MSAALGVSVVAIVAAVAALVLAIRTDRRLRSAQSQLASIRAGRVLELKASADNLAASHQSTIDEVAALLENLMVKVDTDIAVLVAEGLSFQESSRHADGSAG